MREIQILYTLQDLYNCPYYFIYELSIVLDQHMWIILSILSLYGTTSPQYEITDQGILSIDLYWKLRKIQCYKQKKKF